MQHIKQKKTKQNTLVKIGFNFWSLLTKAIFAGIMLFLLWSTWAHTKPNNFPIKYLKIISTHSHLDQKALQNIIKPYLNSGFFYLNVIGMKKELLKIPWVDTVQIRRRWPNTVVVNIKEQQAVLRWGGEGLINSQGQLFFPPINTFPKELPTVFGPQEREFEIFNLYKAAQNLFIPFNLSIKKIVFESQRYWEVFFDNNMIVYLKDPEPLKQLELLAALYQKIKTAHPTPPKSIDLRYNTDGLAIRWT